RPSGACAKPGRDPCDGDDGQAFQGNTQAVSAATPMPIPKMRQLFGTDGIRGIAGEYPLDRRTVYAIGRALGQRLAEHHVVARVLIGQDTRESSGLIGAVLAAGLEAAPVQVGGAGIITTLGIAYLTRANHFSAGIV